MTDKIKAALLSLDPTNDNHWTQDGSPRLETVRLLSANPSLSRETVNDVIPGFSRAVASGAANTEEKKEPTQEELAAQAAAEAAAQAAPPAPVSAPAPATPETPATPAVTETPADNVFGNLLGEGLAELEPDQDRPLADLLDSATEYLSELLDARQRLDAEVVLTQNSIASLQSRVDAEIKAQHTTSPIQAYLASQVKLGQERGELRRTVADVGIDLKELQSRLSASPLDTALGSRKRQPRLNTGS